MLSAQEGLLPLNWNTPMAARTILAIATVVGLYKLSGWFLREYLLVPKMTILRDLENLHKPRRDGKLPGRAVVCGGSIAGLLAASVCADHFESVLVIEPDSWANEHGDKLPKHEDRVYRTVAEGHKVVTPPRSRIMQYYMVNFLQAPVLLVLRRLFPNLLDLVDELGLTHALSVIRLELRYCGFYYKDPYPATDLHQGAPLTLDLSREATEVLIRRAVKRTRHNVVFQTGTVTGFLREGERLRGVTVRTCAVDIHEEPADFVVDASGPSQMSYSKWLPAVGFQLPPDLRTEYNPNLDYITATFTIPPQLLAKWPDPMGYRTGIVFALPADAESGNPKQLGVHIRENYQVYVIVNGQGINSVSDLRAYTQAVEGSACIPTWVWELYDLLEKHGDECKPFWSHCKVSRLQWVRWFKVANDGLPGNWVSVGDANMVLNPIYGQGITKACIDVTTLDAILRGVDVGSEDFGTVNVPRRFHKRLTPRVQGLWEDTRVGDYGWPTTIPAEGEDLSYKAWARRIGKICLMLARDDPELYSKWWHIVMMLAPMTDLITPSILLRMARYQLLGW